MTKLLCFGILLTAGATHGEGTTAKNSIPWSQIGAKAGVDYNGDGLAVTPTESGARLHCVFQRLDGEATSQGLWLTSTVTDTVSDRFRITAMAVGRIADGPLTPCLSPSDGVRVAARPGEGQLPRTGSVSVTGQTVRFSRPGLTEEYSVSMDGVRQDFIVGESFGRARLRQSRPSRQSAGYLVVKLAVTGAKVESAACGARLVLENSGRKIAYSRLRVTDATGKELRARIEVCPADDEEPSFTSWSESSPLFEQLSLFTAVATEAQEALAVVVDDADAVYPVRIDPTFGDANWVSMGVPPGVTGAVYAAVVDASGNLYIGGGFIFMTAGGVSATNIAQWNGSSWSALGSGVGGMNDWVDALAVSGSTLYAGGSFANAGGLAVTNIAQWNGSSWSALGSGLDGLIGVSALAVSGSTLYAGGRFGIEQWNGSSWSALGSGLNGGVGALAVSGSNLYAGGGFTTAGGVSANNIAQWNGSSWSALGSGLSGEVVYGLEVDALAVSGGTLYVGGDFTTAGTNISAYAAEAIVGASPPPTDYTISVSALPPNEGTASGAGTFPSGSAKTVTAEANSGYAFVDWTENGTVVSSSNSYTFTLNGNVNLVANFTGGSGVSAFQTLDVPNNVGSTSALGVSGGSIVGNYGDNNGFLFNGNSYTTVDVPNPTAPDVPATTIATGISGSNIVGWFTDDAADAHGFLYSNGNFTTLDDPNAASSDNVGTYPPGGYGYILFSTEFDGYGGTFASGISGGNIVGWYVDMSGDTHGFLYNGSTYATLDDPNGVGSTYAQGISGNNIVGFYTDHTGKTHGFLYNGKTYTTLDAPGGVGATYAQGIDGNNIVGWYVNSTTGDHGFLYNGASYTTFDVPNAGGGGSTFAQGISGNTVVGWYFDSNANNHGFSYNTTPGGKDTITLSASPSAGGKVSGAGAFAAGSSVTVTATANGGYTFANWTENGSVISSNASYTFTVNENQTLVANFAIKGNPKLTITAPKSGQSVSNALLPVVGTVTDKVAVDDVYYQLNNTGWTLATSSNSWSNWAGTVTLVPGSNAISAYAVDASGAFSATNTNHVVYVVTGELQVTMVPPTATNLGAQWRVDGGAFHKSGVIVSNLLVGNHTLFFKSVPGFATPSNQAVSIASNQVTLATGAYLDTTQPTLTILSPTANLRVSNAVFTVTGKAADNVAVSNVLYQLNNDGWSNAGSTNHWTNWTASITSAPGSNTLQACAVDTSANYSLTNTVHFTYIPSATLTVRTNGLGSITPVDNGKLLAIGTNYAVKAAPANNWLFSNWLGGATAPYPALTNGPTLTFAMQSNLVLEANFVTNPFPAIAGSFNGLFYQTNGSPVTEQSSGFATITIASTSKGAYTAKLLLDGGSYSFTGAFDLNGNSVTNLTRRGESPLTVTLHVNLNTLPPATVMTGAVTATNWAGHSGLVADLAVFNGKTIVASNYAGKYTLVLPGSATPATSPGGYGAATFTNNLAGAAVLGGALGDGTSLGSQSVPISQDGLVPVYVPLYSGQGSVFGWLAFSNLPPKTVSGDLTWFKLSGPAKSLYTNGFTNQGAIIGSVYMPSTTNILALTNGTLTITDPGQNIDLVYTNVTVISNKLTYTAPPTNQLIVTFTPPSGAITVSFRPTGAKANITAQGVVLQGAPTDPSLKAAGWFTGTNETGSFQLRGQ